MKLTLNYLLQLSYCYFRILQLLSTGHLDHWTKISIDYILQDGKNIISDKQIHNESILDQVINLNQFKIAFHIFTIGFGLAFFIMIFEILHSSVIFYKVRKVRVRSH